MEKGGKGAEPFSFERRFIIAVNHFQNTRGGEGFAIDAVENLDWRRRPTVRKAFWPSAPQPLKEKGAATPPLLVPHPSLT